MRWFLFLVATYYVIVGIFLLVAATKTKEIFKRALKNLKALSTIPLLIGVLLAYSASSSRLPWLVVTIGLLAIAKGFFFLLAPEKKSKPFINWWLKASSGIYRLWGLLVLILGIFFFWRVA